MNKLILGITLLVSYSLAIANCTFTVSNLAFGNYDVLNAAVNNSQTNLSLTCTANTAYSISLSAGTANSYQPRHMSNGSYFLNYNLYVDPARTQIWGNGASGTQIVSGTCIANQCRPRTIPIYGQIPPRQDVVASNNYQDSILVTLNFN